MTRTVWIDNHAMGHSACLYALGSGSITVDDSELINCHSEEYPGYGGSTAYVTTGGTVTITNSRISGSSATSKGHVGYTVGGGTLRIASTTTFDSGGDGKFVIYDGTGSDFAIQVRACECLLAMASTLLYIMTTSVRMFLQLDSVIVDATFDIYSTANVLVQNVDGLTSTAVKNATVGACEDTPNYCLASSCRY
jgi:hypothetical protein